MPGVGPKEVRLPCPNVQICLVIVYIIMVIYSVLPTDVPHLELDHLRNSLNSLASFIMHGHMFEVCT